MPRGQDAWIIALVLIGLGGLCILHLITRLLKVYIQLTLAGVPMSLWHFIKIRRRVRGQRLRALAIALIRAHKSALSIPVEALVEHAIQGGRPDQVVAAAIVARSGEVQIPWADLTAADRDGIDPPELAAALVEARRAGLSIDWSEAVRLQRRTGNAGATLRQRARQGTPA